MRVEYTGPALDDLLAITDYLARDNPTAANRTKDRIFAATDLLTNPALDDPAAWGEPVS